MIAHYLGRLGVLARVEECVRLARRRFGHYELIDFAVVLIGYAIIRGRITPLEYVVFAARQARRAA